MSTERILQDKNSNDEYGMTVKVFLTIDNFRLIFTSPYFRQALEQTLKDYVNGDPQCIDGSNSKNDLEPSSFTTFDIDFTSQLLANEEGKKFANNSDCVLLGSNWGGLEDITCYVEIKTKCRGPREECKKKFNDRLIDNNIVQEKNNKTGSKKSVCDINDLLREKASLSSIFKFGITESEQNLTFDFQQSSSSLSGIGNVKAGDDLAEIDVIKCHQCEVQPEILQEFYQNFGVDFYYVEQECQHQGINCNEENMATQIWLSKFMYMFGHFIIFENKIDSNVYSTFSDNKNITNEKIADRIGNLRSLRGLFLGKLYYFSTYIEQKGKCF